MDQFPLALWKKIKIYLFIFLLKALQKLPCACRNVCWTTAWSLWGRWKASPQRWAPAAPFAPVTWPYLWTYRSTVSPMTTLPRRIWSATFFSAFSVCVCVSATTLVEPQYACFLLFSAVCREWSTWSPWGKGATEYLHQEPFKWWGNLSKRFCRKHFRETAKHHLLKKWNTSRAL